MLNEFVENKKYQLKVRRANENIIGTKDMDKVINDVFDDLAKMISRTIGPGGGNTLLTEGYGSTPIFPAKDGFRVMNDHVYDDILYESIYRIIRDICGRMNESIGDSTTSGVIIARSLYKQVRKYLKKHPKITRFGIKNLLELVYEEVSSVLKSEYVVNLNNFSDKEREDIYSRIANVSTNNDREIAENTVKAYAGSPTYYSYVDIKESVDEDDLVVADSGFEIPAGFILTHMATSGNGYIAEYDNPKILLIDGVVTNFEVENFKKFIDWVCVDMRSPLVIICAGFEQKVLDLMTRLITGVTVNGPHGPQVVKYPIVGIPYISNEQSNATILDLEACLGCHAIQTNKGYLQQPPTSLEEISVLLGSAGHVKSAYAITRFRNGGGSKELRSARIEKLEENLRDATANARGTSVDASRIETLKRRIGMLQGQMSTIFVGGHNFKEKSERKLVYEDAVCAIRASVNNGITLGGQVCLYDALVRHYDDITNNIACKIIAELGASDRKYNIGVKLTPADVRKSVDDIVDVLKSVSLVAYKTVLDNAIKSEKVKKEIIGTIDKYARSEAKAKKNGLNGIVYNLITDRYETMEDVTKIIPRLIVPGNTDYELLRSVITVIESFITSNQIMSVHVKKHNEKQ